jgi:capsular exopolysaccharide synthesis family protein
LVIFVGFQLLVVFWTMSRPRVYRAEATLQFDPTPPRPLGKNVDMVAEVGNSDTWDNREYYETQYKIVQSRRIATATAQALSLNRDAGFLQLVPPGKTPEPLRKPVTVDEAADIVRERLTLTPVRESRLAVVGLEDTDPARAYRVLTVLVNSYIELNLDAALNSTSSATDWLRGQLDTVKHDLEGSEMALHTFKQDRNILSVDIDAQSNMLREEMKQLNDTLTGVREHRENLVARRDVLLKVATDDPARLPASELLQSPLLQQLRQHYVDAVRAKAELLAHGKGENHPDVQAANASVDTTRGALLTEVKNIQGSVQHDLDVAEHEAVGLSAMFDQANKKALDLNLMEIEYNRLHRTKENNEKLYGMLLERTKEADLARMMRVNNLSVLDAPLVSSRPVRPRVAVNLAVGALLGFILGTIAAVARALVDRTIKTPADVELDLQLPFLGLMPVIAAATQAGPGSRRRRRIGATVSPDLIVHESSRSGAAEAARAMRTNLMFMAPDRPYRTLLVTSAGPAEGKTTIACCVATAMAQAGQKVLLLDCDLRRPRLHRVFNRSLGVGLTNVLLDDSATDSALNHTDVPNLDVMTAGPLPPNPAELLQSERFKTVLHALSDRYDRIILDSAPAAAVTDPAILSRVTDGTVLVVRAYTTTRDLARHGSRSILGVGGHIAGIVLNAVDLDRHEYKYYHYYYAKPGYFYGSQETPPTPPPPSASVPLQ